MLILFSSSGDRLIIVVLSELLVFLWRLQHHKKKKKKIPPNTEFECVHTQRFSGQSDISSLFLTWFSDTGTSVVLWLYAADYNVFIHMQRQLARLQKRARTDLVIPKPSKDPKSR